MSKLHIILTCDGGSGHKSAAEALQKKAMSDGDQVEVINTTRTGWFSGGGLNISPEYDHLFYKGFIDLGPFATRWWDWAQRTSHTELLRAFASLRKLSFLSIPSFRHRSYHLLKDRQDINDHTEVVFHNTQPNCVQALIYSIARYNREVKAYNKEHPDKPRNIVKLVNHFTDMPTLQAQMFIEEMAKIDVADIDDAQFELHTRPPIISDDNPDRSTQDTELLYHQKTKQLYPKLYENVQANTHRVKFVDGPIRSEFVHRKINPAERRDGLNINFTNKVEFGSFNATLTDNKLSEFNATTSHANMPLNEDTEVVSLMLGSQASIEGTIALVQEEIKFATESSKPKYVFVFCGADKPKEGLVLYQKVLDIAKTVNGKTDSNIRIIPLTNQPGSVIADVYSLADRVITRPGGISIMEIEAVVKRGKVFVFTELGKLEKLFNHLLSRSDETLKKKFIQQTSQQRYTDLIAWEWGNALHARNICKDSQGRTRVVPVNIYTFQKELEFSNKKEAVSKLIADTQYLEAFNQLKTTPELNVFFLTGHDVGVDLACLVEITQLYDQISNDLSDLIKKHKGLDTLENGPGDTLTLINEVRERILTELKKKTIPSDILKDVSKQIYQIKASLENSIHVVKQSNIENKTVIIRTLEFLSRALLNFFRLMVGLHPEFNPETELAHLNKNIKKAISRPIMVKIDQYGDGSISQPPPLVSNVDASQWLEFDNIIEKILKDDPAQKNKTFIIKKTDYPQLTQDFLHCRSLEADVPVPFVIFKVLGEGGEGKVSLLQNRSGECIVMKEPTKEMIEKRLYLLNSERDCLREMGMLIDNVESSSDKNTLLKYISGETLQNYLIQDNLVGFVRYKSFTTEDKIKLAIAVASGLKNVLDKGITHADIMPANILIQENANNTMTSTLIDFGYSHLKQRPNLNFVPYISPYYGAPELLQASRMHTDGTSQDYPYSDKSDIYSLGIILKDMGIDPALITEMTLEDPTKRMDINQVLTTLSAQLNALENNYGEEGDEELGFQPFKR